MVDPYAPPRETSGDTGRTNAPTPTVETYRSTPASSGQMYRQTYEAPEYDEPHGMDRARYDRRGRRPENRERAEPARLGLFWTVAAVGIGLLLLARLMLYFAIAEDLPGDETASALFATLGVIALSAGLCLAALLQRGLAVPWRIALLIAAGAFAVLPDGAALTGFGFA